MRERERREEDREKRRVRERKRGGKRGRGGDGEKEKGWDEKEVRGENVGRYTHESIHLKCPIAAKTVKMNKQLSIVSINNEICIAAP